MFKNVEVTLHKEGNTFGFVIRGMYLHVPLCVDVGVGVFVFGCACSCLTCEEHSCS